MKRILLIAALGLLFPLTASAQCSGGVCQPLRKVVKVSVVVARDASTVIVAAPRVAVRVVNRVRPIRRILSIRILQRNRYNHVE